MARPIEASRVLGVPSLKGAVTVSGKVVHVRACEVTFLRQGTACIHGASARLEGAVALGTRVGTSPAVVFRERQNVGGQEIRCTRVLDTVVARLAVGDGGVGVSASAAVVRGATTLASCRLRLAGGRLGGGYLLGRGGLDVGAGTRLGSRLMSLQLELLCLHLAVARRTG